MKFCLSEIRRIFAINLRNSNLWIMPKLLNFRFPEGRFFKKIVRIPDCKDPQKYFFLFPNGIVGRLLRECIDPTAPFKMYSGGFRAFKPLSFKMHWVGSVRSSLPILMHAGSIAIPKKKEKKLFNFVQSCRKCTCFEQP